MRRSRPRKRIISIRQSGGWSKTGTSSSVPSYEYFKIPTPRGFPSKGVSTPGNNTMDMSVTGRKRPASDAEHVQESTSSGALLQTERGGNNEGDFACQHSLDGGVGSTRPEVKQIVVRLAGLRQLADTSGELLSVNHGGEPVKDMGTEIECHRAVWSNATDCSESRQNYDCSHPDFQSSQHVKPIVRILRQALQIPEEREPKEKRTETPKEDTPGPPVNGENSGGSLGNLAPVAENRFVPESTDEQARSGLPGHDFPARNCFPYPANPSWMPNANECRSCPGTTFPTNSQSVSGCNACAGSTRFTSPDCSFQRGVPRAVRYFVEPASLNEIKCFPRRTEAPACCQRMNFKGPVMYAAQAMKQTSVDLGGRNLVQPPHGHTCGTAHCLSGDDHVLVCPAPWVHKGRVFPGVPAICVDQQKFEVNWAPPESECQPKPTEASSLREMPDPVFPPAHHTPNFSAVLDMDTQRLLEEQIAHEILLLSQKLANLQARYGARHVAHDNTKPAVLSCPQTPLLLDNTTTQRVGKCSNARAPSMNEDTNQQRPATSSSSRSASHRQPDSRCQVEERKFGGRFVGPNTKGAPSITSSRGSDSGTTVALNRNHPNSRRSFGPGNSTVRAVDVTLVQQWGKALRETVQTGKPSNKSRAFRRNGRELVDQCSYSDDMKEHLTGGASVQRYPDGNKRFDWVKKLRFGGVSVRENQGCADFTSQMNSKPSSLQKEFTDVDAETWLRDSSEHEVVPTSMRKSVQAGGLNSPDGREDARPIEVDDSETRPKRRPDSSIGKPVFTRVVSPEEMGCLDSRLAHHLVKVGLRRAPSFWRVPGIRPVPNANLKLKKKTFGSRSPRKVGGKRLCLKTLFDPTSNAPEAAAAAKGEENVSQEFELKGEPTDEATECAMVGDYEAEYETFVEKTSDVGQRKNNLDSKEYTSVVNREALTSQEDGQTKSRSSCSCQEKARLSELPVVSLTKHPPHQAAKKTFIRCFELVVATKKKNQVLYKLNGRKDSEYNPHRKIVDCSERTSVGMERDRTHVLEGVACQDDSQVAEEQIIAKPKQSAESSSAVALVETQRKLKIDLCEDSMAGDGGGKEHLDRSPKVLDNRSRPETVIGHSPILQTKSGPPNLGGCDCGSSSSFPTAIHQVTAEVNEQHNCVAPSSNLETPYCVVDQVSSLAFILSRVMPKQMEAEQLEARWEEIFDALEKERLGLPKIKTGSRKIGVTTRTSSPRDSGGVKRIAEQLKSSTKLDKAQGKSALEEATVPKGRPQWSKIQQQKQAVVF